MGVMKDRMHTGELYLPGDEEILERQFRCLDRLYDFNMTRPTEMKKREALLKEMFAEIGEGCISSRRFTPISGAVMYISANLSMPTLI